MSTVLSRCRHYMGEKKSKRSVYGGNVYEILRPRDGGGEGLKPYAYNEYVTPNNKMILRERRVLHYFINSALFVSHLKPKPEHDE